MKKTFISTIPTEADIEERMPLEEWAALWGCDPCYDKAPRLPGDGYMFYNFSVEGNDKAFLKLFLPAVKRTLQEIHLRKVDKWYSASEKQRDIERMGEMEAEVSRRLCQ